LVPPVPLYVDLDGSLISSDLLIESALKLLKAHPFNLIRMVAWLRRGKAHLKTRIADEAVLDVTTLPYNADVIAVMEEARGARRRVVLATASHARYAEAVASHLGLFDGVLATDIDRNLSGGAKLLAIRDDARGLPFEYLGNGTVDLEIWREAAAAVVVTADQSLLERAQRVTSSVRHIRVASAGPRAWGRAVRLHQWAKNLLLFMPALPLVSTLDPRGWVALCLGFVAFGLCASSVYILNDLLDLESDRMHVRKRRRPIPSGEVPLVQACALCPVLLLTSFVVAAALLPWQFMVVLALYWVSTMAYSFFLKKRVLIDIMTLASLYTIRILAGAAAIRVPPSFWILIFSLFIFLSLAAAKRYVELLGMQNQQRAKAAGRGYLVTDIPFVLSLGTCSGLTSVLVFALYVNDPVAREHLHQPYALWLVCPLLLYWMSRVWLKATRGELHDDPVVFAVTDRVSQIVAVLGLLLVIVAARL
jgi:4-hydroxybenzoate polyprenyltransferase/phosphoserine phosphatase